MVDGVISNPSAMVKALQEEYGNVRIETVGPKLRAMFSWNNGKDDDADMATFTGKIARG